MLPSQERQGIANSTVLNPDESLRNQEADCKDISGKRERPCRSWGFLKSPNAPLFLSNRWHIMVPNNISLGTLMISLIEKAQIHGCTLRLFLSQPESGADKANNGLNQLDTCDAQASLCSSWTTRQESDWHSPSTASHSGREGFCSHCYFLWGAYSHPVSALAQDQKEYCYLKHLLFLFLPSPSPTATQDFCYSSTAKQYTVFIKVMLTMGCRSCVELWICTEVASFFVLWFLESHNMNPVHQRQQLIVAQMGNSWRCWRQNRYI